MPPCIGLNVVFAGPTHKLDFLPIQKCSARRRDSSSCERLDFLFTQGESCHVIDEAAMGHHYSFGWKILQGKFNAANELDFIFGSEYPAIL